MRIRVLARPVMDLSIMDQPVMCTDRAYEMTEFIFETFLFFSCLVYCLVYCIVYVGRLIP